jgi:hypothetical protein
MRRYRNEKYYRKVATASDEKQLMIESLIK